eukprot:scaffold1034_cov16-Tisochrysis_lutea.AAC.1
MPLAIPAQQAAVDHDEDAADATTQPCANSRSCTHAHAAPNTHTGCSRCQQSYSNSRSCTRAHAARKTFTGCSRS